jgi:DNA-binding transcriptional MerR regulator
MKINELEDLLGVSKATIRYYEDQGLVTPPRTDNGYREYSDEEVQLFQKIIVLRKLGLGIPEIRDLIDGKAELHDVLEYNMERLRTRRDEIASAIELCGKIEAESNDFASIDSPKYLKHIYENEQKGAHFAETKEISVRQLNLAITLLGMLAGAPVIQNKQFSEHSNDKPLPADIRANKKEGDEYATVGTVLKKGGKLKTVLVVVLLLFLALGIFNGLSVWGGLGFNVKYIFDYNKSGITTIKPNDDELAQIAAIDSAVVDACKMSSLYKFHTKGRLQLSVKRSSDGKWTEIDRQVTNAKEGYLFITGDPSSCIELHIISDTSAMKYTTEINDNAYRKETTKLKIFDGEFAMYEGEEEAIALFLRNEKDWPEATDDMNELFFGEVLTETPPDGCYAVTVQDVK